MKKQIAIFVLLVFFLAQFGKVLNYCLCSIAAYQQTSSFACDCEKQLFTDLKNETAGKHPLPHTYAAQTATEELFHLSLFSRWVFQYPVTVEAWPRCGNEPLYHITGNAVFHPPLQAV